MILHHIIQLILFANNVKDKNNYNYNNIHQYVVEVIKIYLLILY